MGAQAVDLVVAPSGEQSHQQQKPHKKKEGFEAWKNQSAPTRLFYSKKKKRVRGQEKKKKTQNSFVLSPLYFSFELFETSSPRPPLSNHSLFVTKISFRSLPL
jgi:hypothetical protein